MSVTLGTVERMSAPRVSKSQGTDQELLDVVLRRPGLSKYELAKAIYWSMGKTDGAITRLLGRRLIFLKILEREGRRVNLIYPIDYFEPDCVRVSVEGLGVGSGHGVMYALDSTVIGVTRGENEDWGRIALMQRNIPLEVSGGDIVFKIPEEFRRFYQLHHRHYVVSVSPIGVLITVSGEIRRT